MDEASHHLRNADHALHEESCRHRPQERAREKMEKNQAKMPRRVREVASYVQSKIIKELRSTGNFSLAVDGTLELIGFAIS